MSDEIVLKPYDVSIALDVPRNEVWNAVTQPAALHQWFGWDYDGLDAEIEHLFVNEATLIAPERMGWADGSYLEVVGDESGCVVRAVRNGPPPDDPDRYDAIEEAWRSFLVQLRFWLTERPRGTRRTVYLTGETTGRQVLALTGRPAGWNRGGLRTASAVTPPGHLIVVASRGHLDSPHPNRTEVIISTYGLDEEAFEACRAGWTDRWALIAADAAVTVAGQPAPR